MPIQGVYENWRAIEPNGDQDQMVAGNTATWNDGTNFNGFCGTCKAGYIVECGVEAIDKIQEVIDDFQGIVADPSTDPDLADRVQDAIAELQDALDELNETPPDNADAVGSIGNSVEELQDAIDEGLDPTQATQLMDQLAGIARQIAVDAIDQAASTPGSDPDAIQEAQDLLAEGDTLRVAGAFEDAVEIFEEAVDEAEDALP